MENESMTIAQLQARAYQQAKDKGFHDNDVPVGDAGWIEHDFSKMMLIVTEVAEAVDELRTGKLPTQTYYHDPHLPNSLVAEVGVAREQELIERCSVGKLRKPEGVPSELADVVIRVFDYAGIRGIDLQAIILEKLDYNATRPAMHGGRTI